MTNDVRAASRRSYTAGALVAAAMVEGVEGVHEAKLTLLEKVHEVDRNCGSGARWHPPAGGWFAAAGPGPAVGA